jgi:sugar O-acyltransferase (sialic acid O-acetyltransferase NeuD family)
LYEIAGIIDKKELIGQKILDCEIIGCDEDLEDLFDRFKYVIITVGQLLEVNKRIELYDLVKSIGYELPVIISSRAYVSKYAQIQEGTVVMHDVLINASAVIGKNCIINSKALVEHDAVIQDYCHISTGAVINGGVVVEEQSFIGSNSVTKEYITIPKSSFIKAGSLVK